VVREPLADGPTLNTLHSPFSRNGADTISWMVIWVFSHTRSGDDLIGWK
jgi:hypothetical protein